MYSQTSINSESTRILITGARAPIAVEWAQRMLKEGATIFLADSLYYPIARFSGVVRKYYYLPNARNNPLHYINTILEIVKKESIEIIIPTCEEVFYLSYFKKHLPASCQLFADDFQKLASFHNKYEIMNLATDIEIKTPTTLLLSTPKEAAIWMQKNQQNQNLNRFILKPVFSRFASHVILDITQAEMNKFRDCHYPLIAQEKIVGQEFCSYSLAKEGQLVGHTCYRPLYRAGVGAGIYFEPYRPQSIERFVKDFVKRHHYSGQIAFDFIETTSKETYLLECNPRGTSGLHLLENEGKLLLKLKALQSRSSIMKTDAMETNASPIRSVSAPLMLTIGMWLYLHHHLKAVGLKQFIKDYRRATGIFQRLGLGMKMNLLQLISFLEIALRAFIYRQGFLEVTTRDIEWNGEKIDKNEWSKY